MSAVICCSYALQTLTEVKKMGAINGWQEFLDDGLCAVMEAWLQHLSGQQQQEERAGQQGRMDWPQQHVLAALRTMLSLMKVGYAVNIPAMLYSTVAYCYYVAMQSAQL